MRRTLGAAAALALGAGCSLVVSTSGLADGDEGNGAADAASTDGSTGPSDAGSTDALRDSAMPGAETSATFCSQAAHAFCDDFERPDPVLGTWSGMNLFSGGASLALSTDRAMSLPKALRAMHPARLPDAGANTYAKLERNIGLTAQRVVIAFDVYVAKPQFTDADSTIGIACFGVRKGGLADGACISLAADYVAFSQVAGAAMPFDAWVHISASIDHGGMGNLTIDGLKRSGQPIRESEPGTRDQVHLSLGIHGYNQPIPAMTAYFDNVTIDTF